MAAKKKAKQRDRRRIREVGDSELVSLVNSLDYDELLTAFVRLSGAERGSRPKSIDDAIEWILGCGRSVKEITKTLQRIESETPKKHCYFGTVVGDVAAASQRLEKASLRGTKIAYMMKEEGILCVTAVKIVQAIDREWVGERGKRIGHEVTRQLRHAIVVRISVETKRVTMTFPPLPPGAQEDFDAVIRAVVDLLKGVGLAVLQLPVRACISSLLRGGARRVAVSRGKFETNVGRIHVASTARDLAIDSVLVRMLDLQKTDEREKIEHQFNQSLQRQTFESVTLAWIDEKVNTRIEFIPIGPEFLFFWGDTDRSYQRIDDMIGLLYDIATGLESADYRGVWDALTQIANGSIVTPHEFASRFAVEASVPETVLVDAVTAGIVEPVYLLRAEEELLEANGIQQWTADLMQLRRPFEHGSTVVDGTDPKNIRVGFKRTHYSAQAEER